MGQPKSKKHASEQIILRVASNGYSGCGNFSCYHKWTDKEYLFSLRSEESVQEYYGGSSQCWTYTAIETCEELDRYAGDKLKGYTETHHKYYQNPTSEGKEIEQGCLVSMVLKCPIRNMILVRSEIPSLLGLPTLWHWQGAGSALEQVGSCQFA